MREPRVTKYFLDQLYEERFQVLIRPDNADKVMEFCNQLLRDAASTELSDISIPASLWNQLKKERFQALIRPENADKVRNFCNQLLQDDIPTELLNIGPEKRNYDLLGFLQGKEEGVNSGEMVRRASRMNARSDEDEAHYLVESQDSIPVATRRKVSFVSVYRGGASTISWVGRWVRLEVNMRSPIGAYHRVLRRRDT